MTPAIKRQLFPLRAPRTQTQCFWPVHFFAAAVDGYYQAYFACLRGTAMR